MTGALWATISGFGFGVFQAFNRRGGRSFDPYIATFILLAGSAVILAIASVLTEDLGQFNGVPLAAYMNFGLAGLFHFFIGWTFLTISQNKVGAARTGALVGTTPLFAIFISALAFKEYLRLPILGGIFMLVLGVYLVSFAVKPGGHLDKITWRNSLYGLGTAVCFSISPIFIRNGLEQLPSPLLGVTVGMAFSALAYGVILALRRDHIEQGVITGDALIISAGCHSFCWPLDLDALDCPGFSARGSGAGFGEIKCPHRHITLAVAGWQSPGGRHRSGLVGRGINRSRFDRFEFLLGGKADEIPS